MDSSSLSTMAPVRPLEPRWRAVLDGVAQGEGHPTSHDVKALGAAVARLSAYYNGLEQDIPARQALAARLSFSFARDVPKGAAAVSELVASGWPGERATLRVLDLGAGLGAMTWGLARALDAAGWRGTVEATLVDRDAAALALAARIAARAGPEGGVAVSIRTVVGDASDLPAAPADLVLIGQALSEMHRSLPPAERAARHAEVLDRLLQQRVAPDGVLVVIEPALRDRTRHLHDVRGRLIAAGWSVFAPCLHDATCPMLARPDDWCHEDLPVDLPDWLVGIARAASLRFQGLTFSYLVLRRDRATLRERLPAGTQRLVAAPRLTKGKTEAELCGDDGRGPARRTVTRLDRARSPANAPWNDLTRGDLLTLAPPGDRVGSETQVDRRRRDR
ncbi:MAG: methyltransferase domain-containing protein [Myxococcales bacterium]|nr:MAG: methyltransferase domain-containing protein [Myxococcales bacterium]